MTAKIAIIGRPNVGKSSLFNRLMKKRIAIVDDVSGTTRDRLHGLADFFGKSVDILDTAGIAEKLQDPNYKAAEAQTHLAIQEAQLILLMVDGQVGLQSEDLTICRNLQKLKKKTLLVINKIDQEENIENIHTFEKLGITKQVLISTLHGANIAELMELVVDELKHIEPNSSVPIDATFCIVGVPNVGKSTLLNAFVQEKRAATSNVAGTTRDSIEDLLSYNEKNFLVIDTAGIVKKNSQKKVVEKFAHIRMEKSIEKADICLFVTDSSRELTTREKRILNDLQKSQKSCVMLLNKWDLMSNTRQEHALRYLKAAHPFLNDIPMLCISGKTKKGLEKILPALERVLEEKKQDLPTSKINQTLQKALINHNPPAIQGKRLRIYYATQTSKNPPTFLLFVNYKNLLTKTYLRYLTHEFKKTFGFFGSPIVFNLRKKSSSKAQESSQVIHY